MGANPKKPGSEGLPPLRLVPGIDLVGVGGRLEPAGVLAAYRSGVFPWYEAGGPLLWWSPDPRAILPLPSGPHVTRRLARTLRSKAWRYTTDTAFVEVMHACNEDREDGVWIHPEMISVYGALHTQGHAHSLEVWEEQQLVGGIYGVAFGGGFAAESMFHRVRDASKAALVALADHLRAIGFSLLDVQFRTPHLARFACREIPREQYLREVARVRSDGTAWRPLSVDGDSA